MTEPDKDSIFKSSVVMGGAHLISIILGMLTVVVLARCLKIEDFGYYQLFVSIVGLMTVFTLPGMSQIIKKCALKNKDYVVVKLVKRSVLCASASGFIAIVIGLVFSSIFGNVMIGALIACAGIMVIFKSLDTFDHFLQGKLNFSISRKIFICVATTKLIVVGTIAWATNNIFCVIGGALFVLIISLIIGWKITLKHMDKKKMEMIII